MLYRFTTNFRFCVPAGLPSGRARTSAAALGVALIFSIAAAGSVLLSGWLFFSVGLGGVWSGLGMYQ